MKTCTKCQITQELGRFPIHRSYKDGRSTWCRGCLGKQAKAWSQNNRDRENANQSRRNKENPSIRQGIKFKTRYGITLAQFEEMSKAQDYKCAICYKEANKNKNGKLFVDHDHNTGKVRGLLCDGCNRGIGDFKENIDALNSAIFYLQLNR